MDFNTSPGHPFARVPQEVLVVDDDPNIRLVITVLLKRAGLVVHSVIDGVEAVEWVAKPENHADLVILDLAMPRMSGSEAMEHIRDLRPTLSIVLCSGSVVDLARTAKSGGDAVVGVVSKPFETDDFTQSISKALQGRGVKVAWP